MISVRSAARWAAALASTLALTAPPTPPADPPVVDVLSVSGAGCPPGTVFVRILPDNTGFDLAYDGFLAVSGGIGYRKNCQLSLLVHPPHGYTYALTHIVHRGYAHLEPGATAQMRTRHHFAGTAPGPLIPYPFTGPFEDDWHLTEVIEPAGRLVAPCGEQPALNVAAELRVTPGTDTDQPSWINLQASGWPAFTSYHLEWTECPAE